MKTATTRIPNTCHRSNVDRKIKKVAMVSLQSKKILLKESLRCHLIPASMPDLVECMIRRARVLEGKPMG